MTPESIEQLEIDLLFEAIQRRYGYDFRHYSGASASRRVLHRMAQEGVESVSALQHKVLHDEVAADALLRDLSINVTEMFRDPPFYKSLQQFVLPHMDGVPHFKIWHAGCATGEEVYSMAILLSEEELIDRARIYATDFNNVALDIARSGIFPLGRMRLYSENYRAAGGRCSLADYFYANYNGAVMDERLKAPIIFAHHDLVSDSSFGEMQVIVCRNVLIYFDRSLQERVLHLFCDSLSDGGFLCLGSHETIMLSGLRHRFESVVDQHKIYRKVT